MLLDDSIRPWLDDENMNRYFSYADSDKMYFIGTTSESGSSPSYSGGQAAEGELYSRFTRNASNVQFRQRQESNELATDNIRYETVYLWDRHKYNNFLTPYDHGVTEFDQFGDWNNNNDYNHPYPQWDQKANDKTYDASAKQGYTSASDIDQVSNDAYIELSCNSVNILPIGGGWTSDPNGNNSISNSWYSGTLMDGDLIVSMVGDYWTDFIPNNAYKLSFGGSSDHPVELEYNFPQAAILNEIYVMNYQTGGWKRNGYNGVWESSFADISTSTHSQTQFTAHSVTRLVFRNYQQNTAMQLFFQELADLRRGLGAVGIWIDDGSTAIIVESDETSSVVFSSIQSGQSNSSRIINTRVQRNMINHTVVYEFALTHPDFATLSYSNTANWSSSDGYITGLDISNNIVGMIQGHIDSNTISFADSVRLWKGHGTIVRTSNTTFTLAITGDAYHADAANISSQLLPNDTISLNNVSGGPTDNEYIVAQVTFTAGVNTIQIISTGPGIDEGSVKGTLEAWTGAAGDYIQASTIVLTESNPVYTDDGINLEGSAFVNLQVKGFQNDRTFTESNDLSSGDILIETPDYILNDEFRQSNVNQFFMSIQGATGTLTVEYAINNQSGDDVWKPAYKAGLQFSGIDIATLTADSPNGWNAIKLYLNADKTAIKNITSIRFRLVGNNVTKFKLNDINIAYRDKRVG